MQVRHFNLFSDLIKSIRRHHGLSQRALARVLKVSPGYIGQWELRLSQPSAEVTMKICRVFSIDDMEYVQRLAYAQRAPQWLRDSIIKYKKESNIPTPPSPMEQRILDACQRLNADQVAKLAERVEGWVEAIVSEQEKFRSHLVSVKK